MGQVTPIAYVSPPVVQPMMGGVAPMPLMGKIAKTHAKKP